MVAFQPNDLKGFLESSILELTIFPLSGLRFKHSEPEREKMKGKAKVPSFSHEQVRQALDYNPATGAFVWKISPAKNVRAGSRAGGSGDTDGYRYIRLEGEEVTDGRLAWFYMTGEWPDRRIRFKNGDKKDCRFDNLQVSQGTGNVSEFDTRADYMKAHREQNPVFWRKTHLQRRFNLSLEDYNKMLDAQGGKCAICLQPETQKRAGKLKALSVDHSHITGAIRGLLCSDCNTGIGKLKDSTEILMNAVEYLKLHSGGNPNVTLSTSSTERNH
jgi:hypothetical protein